MAAEAKFQQWVVDVFTAHGWTVKHAPVPMRAIGGGRFKPDPRGRGLPDLLLLHDDPPRAYWAECKASDGEMSDEQTRVLKMLRAVADSVREAVAPAPSPLGAFVFAPGSEALIEALARGARG